MSDSIDILPPIPDVALERAQPDGAVWRSSELQSAPVSDKRINSPGKAHALSVPILDKQANSPGQIPEAMKRMPTVAATHKGISYTRESMRDVVHAVAHTLAYFSDKEHQGLREPRNVKRQVPDTGVLVVPRLSGYENLVGFQFYFTDDTLAGHTVDKITAVVFDFEVYEDIGDRYIFNLLKKLSELIRISKRPSDKQLKELSTRFVLSN